jgi:hypothetical protein
MRWGSLVRGDDVAEHARIEQVDGGQEEVGEPGEHSGTRQVEEKIA